MNIEDIVPFSVFRNVQSGHHCNGKHPGTCKCLDRMIAALDCHQYFMMNTDDGKAGKDPKELFIAFCDEYYPRSVMLNDYIHFVDHHSDPSSIEYIKGRLHFNCESITKCGATARHYRDRRDDHDSATDSNLFVDRIDSVHFMVHHLTELGLRVPADTIEKQSEAENKDLALKRMYEVVQSKRKIFSGQRLNSTTNLKFTLQINEQKNGGRAKGTDGVL